MFTTCRIGNPAAYARKDWTPGPVAFWCIKDDEPAAWLILDAEGIVRHGSFQGLARVAFDRVNFREIVETRHINRVLRHQYTGKLAD